VKGRLGYGRYPDGHVGCPRARTDMTPCIARDGGLAADSSDPPVCVGCGKSSYELLVEAVAELSRVGLSNEGDETHE
jgi:hypothetical protein